MSKRKAKDQRQFAADLGKLLVYSDIELVSVEPEDIEHLASMLLLSSGIKQVIFDRSEFDDNLGWCSSADRFQDHQEKLEQLVVDSLTRFLFIWSALEAAVNIFVPDDKYGAPNGKINKLCAFLKNEYEPRNVSEEYKSDLDKLHKLAKSDSHYSRALKLRKMGTHIGFSGFGISSVYSIRNSLSHGSLGVPISQQDEEEFLDAELIDCCSRIVLYTVQMLFNSSFAKNVHTVRWDFEEIEIEMFMKVFHLEVCVSEFGDEDNGLFGA